MNNEPFLRFTSHTQTKPPGVTPKITLQVYIHRPMTQQSVIDFQLPIFTDNEGNLNETEYIDFMLGYHQIKHEDSTMLIHEISEYTMKIITTNILETNYHFQVNLTLTDNNPEETVRLDVDLILTDLEGTTRPLHTEECNDTCTVCFENFNNGSYICALSCGHQFHFPCIDEWLRTNISCPLCRETDV
ncbi:unnamed protein product [Eruca vesicaria subsp. sativa]|uniref:RING-type E3 ubiquitin transferase n=1 Tax=Eruca vesicaria subsp. sativa TaxID=29727 RepID=A0ABC8IVQ0_ERUVS|nr:unnamed protein product [Eruca vesicaria subsp. sativa]